MGINRRHPFSGASPFATKTGRPGSGCSAPRKVGVCDSSARQKPRLAPRPPRCPPALRHTRVAAGTRSEPDRSWLISRPSPGHRPLALQAADFRGNRTRATPCFAGNRVAEQSAPQLSVQTNPMLLRRTAAALQPPRYKCGCLLNRVCHPSRRPRNRSPIPRLAASGPRRHSQKTPTFEACLDAAAAHRVDSMMQDEILRMMERDCQLGAGRPRSWKKPASAAPKKRRGSASHDRLAGGGRVSE